MTASELRNEALALTRAQGTPELVASFQATDDLLEGATVPEWDALTTARGFIIEVLEERGELDLIFPQHEAQA